MYKYTTSYIYTVVFSTMKSLWQICVWTSKLLRKYKLLYQFKQFPDSLGRQCLLANPGLVFTNFPCHLVTRYFLSQLPLMLSRTSD